MEQTRDWILRNARPLDLARWRLHFEGGPREDVFTALAAYQNADGGFGHALEPDCWNPASSPQTTAMALDILHEAGGAPPRGIVEGILRYLASGADMRDGLWCATIPSNNACPRAPWWTYTPETSVWGYNPSVILAGFALAEADPAGALYSRALGIAQGAVAAFLAGKSADMHETPLFVALYNILSDTPLAAELRLDALRDKLCEVAGRVIERDTVKWRTEYVCLPSLFIQSPDSFLYPAYRDLMEAELDMIEAGRGPDGVWPITWRWEAYEREFAISENWWKGCHAVGKLLLLKKFGRI